jgi:hypothetical protein
VLTVALPTIAPRQLSGGLAANAASLHAFCNVLNRATSCLGSVTATARMFA